MIESRLLSIAENTLRDESESNYDIVVSFPDLSLSTENFDLEEVDRMLNL